MRRVTAPTRARSAMTAKTQGLLAELLVLIDRTRKFWPMTVRQVFYAYIQSRGLPSERKLYQKVSDVLTRARLDGGVPWEAIDDHTRGMTGDRGWGEAGTYIDAHRRAVLADYRRNLQQGQTQRLEVWIEKDALAHICARAADPYTVRVAIARGFSSTTFRHDAAKRIAATAEEGLKTIILYFGDLDPSGARMPIDIAQTMNSDFGLGAHVEVWHCGLLPEHAVGLPSSVEAIKPGDPRTPWFRETYPGQHAVELDGLDPEALFLLVRESIAEWIDPKVYAAQLAIEEEEKGAIGTIRERVVAAF